MMMKKRILSCILFLAGSVMAMAQMTAVPFRSATATNYEDGEGAANAIDKNYSTLWHSSYNETTFPITLTLTLQTASHVDVVRYVPRTDGNTNGNWQEVTFEYRAGTGRTWTTVGDYNLGGSGDAYDFDLPADAPDVAAVRFKVKSGSGDFASASEIEAYTYDNTMQDEFRQYFDDELCTQLKAGVTSGDGIANEDIRTLVNNLLADRQEYSKFRIAEYEPYRPVASLREELKNSNPYNQWENPTGIYLKEGDACYVAVSGMGKDKAGLKIKSWGENTDGSTYTLHNGLNRIEAATEGNVFVSYYTDNYETAPDIKVHFINAPVRGYWDRETMTNADWEEMLAKLPSDNSIIVVRSKRAQLVYPVSSWKQYCPSDVSGVMDNYEKVQWAERDMMGLTKFGRETRNRQLFYCTTSGFMAANDMGAFCNINSLNAIMTPDVDKFGFWAVGHEWGHNNQIIGFLWSGCGETTNNIYASWAQIHNTPADLRLEDEMSGIGEYANMRGGRMQAYFDEALRKGVQWQLQEGPDYYGTKPDTKTVANYDYDGNYLGTVQTTSRNYDHFVKLTPFWQMNLWGTLAGKKPDIIPSVIERLRTAENYTETYNTNGKQQINWMKLACDEAGLNLLPFFEKAGMLLPISAYIEDYGAGWNKISQSMIDDLKKYVAQKGYPDVTEEINYITGHNYHIYRDNLKLSVPEAMGEGCTRNGNKVTVQHSKVQNAVAYETYNRDGKLLRITMYALGSDADHSYTQVLFPSSDDEADNAAYIMAVGYDGTRKTIFDPDRNSLFSNDKVYVIKSGRSSIFNSDYYHYLLYHPDAPDYLSSTYGESGHKMTYSDETENFRFAIYWNATGKYYFYNIAAGKFIGNADGNNAPIPLVEEPTNDVQVRKSSNGSYPYMLSTNGTGALNVAATEGCNGVVNWTDGYDETADYGNIYQIYEVGDLDASVKATIEDKVAEFTGGIGTGIHDVKGQDDDDVIYDLTGRRVKTAGGHGLFIMNGRKVLM